MKNISHKKHNINFYKNNIFDTTASIIKAGNNGSTVIVPHVCNNVNLFGAGFALAVAEQYPIVKQNFHLLSNKNKLGSVQYITVMKDNHYRRELIFANMIAQNKTISQNNSRPLNYEALVNCMIDVRAHINKLKDNEHDRVEIHCPKFGCGLAGGNWGFINDLIEDIWKDIPVYVYVLKSK